MAFWNSVPAFTLVSPDDLSHNTFVIPPDEYRSLIEKQEMSPLLPQFEWSPLNVNDSVQMRELFDLLYNYYIEDVSNRFRLHYSIASLRWLLCPPGYVSDWHVGIRVKTSKKLVAFISAIPLIVTIHDTIMESTEVNFLCIHPKLRSHHLAPLLIQEVTRRIGLKNRWTSIYTTGTQITKPLVTTTFYHRSLNIKKLVDTGFTTIKPGVTMTSMKRLYSLQKEPTKKWRPMEQKDIEKCWVIFTAPAQKHTLMPVFTVEEFLHWILPRKDVISSYVLETDDMITDFLSYYLLNTTVIGKSNEILGAYEYYSGITTLTRKEMIHDALILAKSEDCDVFTCIDIMGNEEHLTDLKFTLGTGRSHYYVYNWQCSTITPKEIGLILP